MKPPHGPRRLQRSTGLALVALMSLCTAPRAADIGGWMESRSQAAAVPASAPDCAQLEARAAQASSGEDFFRLALCHLEGARADPDRARGWLDQAVARDYLPAYRMLHLLRLAQDEPHASARHCHDLGQGRRLCHGGASVHPVVDASSPKF